jgi:hypothetical protein
MADILNDELGKIWAGAKESHFNLNFGNCLEGLREATGNFSQGSMSLAREEDPESQRY